MKKRTIAVLACAAVLVLGACEKDTTTKKGTVVSTTVTTVKATTSSTAKATTSTTSAPTTTSSTARATTTTTARATTSTTERTTTTTAAKTVAYANCAEARAAGVTPIYRGQPGYSSSLDRDGDGIACE